MRNSTYTQMRSEIVKAAKEHKRPVLTHFELTGRCNLDCKMCYVHNQDNAAYINKEGYRTHGGADFQSNHILRILKNSIYCGFLKNGEATSDRIESLRIIDDHDFAMAQEILRQRAHKSDEKRTIALHNTTATP